MAASIILMEEMDMQLDRKVRALERRVESQEGTIRRLTKENDRLKDKCKNYEDTIANMQLVIDEYNQCIDVIKNIKRGYTEVVRDLKAAEGAYKQKLSAMIRSVNKELKRREG